MDLRRSGWRSTPESQYPDGYLGTVNSRRGDRLLDGLKQRQAQRPAQRGIHKGDRIDNRDYFWPAEFHPEMGLMFQAQAQYTEEGFVTPRFSSPGFVHDPLAPDLAATPHGVGCARCRGRGPRISLHGTCVLAAAPGATVERRDAGHGRAPRGWCVPMSGSYSPDQFKYLVEDEPMDLQMHVRAYHPESDREIASLSVKVRSFPSGTRRVRQPTKQPQIRGAFVHPDYQRQGIGTEDVRHRHPPHRGAAHARHLGHR